MAYHSTTQYESNSHSSTFEAATRLFVRVIVTCVIDSLRTAANGCVYQVAFSGNANLVGGRELNNLHGSCFDFFVGTESSTVFDMFFCDSHLISLMGVASENTTPFWLIYDLFTNSGHDY
jgi:hypothetical protein